MRALRTLLVAMLAFGGAACGGSGKDGAGGAGGSSSTPRLRFAHLAPGTPSAEDTAVDLLVDGEAVVQDLLFGWASDSVALEPGEYELGVAAAGSSEPILSFSVELGTGDALTVVSYRLSAADPPLDVFLLDGSLDGLQPGDGRVVVAHGADEALLASINVFIDAEGACPPTLISDFELGEQQTLEFPATSFPLAFSLYPPANACTPIWPALSAGVPPDAVTLWVLVDRNTSDNGLSPSVYVLAEDASGQIPDMDPVPQ